MSRAILTSLLLSSSLLAQLQVQRIELDPPAVGSTSSSVFSTLPTANPALFGLGGADVRTVDFDVAANGAPIASGSHLTSEYASIGVSMNSIRISNSVYQGPASPPNATWHDQGHTFNFTVPVVACGIVNTSPDHDTVELWSGPDGTGTLLLRFHDREGLPINYTIDRFVGGRVLAGAAIGSMRVLNASGNCELDELIFEVASCPPPTSYGAGCAGSGGAVPQLGVTGCPLGGQRLQVAIQNGRGGSLAAVLIGFQRGAIPVPGGCTLLISPPVLTLGTAALAGTGAGQGSGIVPLAVPVGVTNLVVDLQAAVLDPGVARGYALSQGSEVTVL